MIDPEEYFACISLGVYYRDMCIPYMPDEFNGSFTNTFYGEEYEFNKDRMIITNKDTGESNTIVEWTNCGIQFTPFKIKK